MKLNYIAWKTSHEGNSLIHGTLGPGKRKSQQSRRFTIIVRMCMRTKAHVEHYKGENKTCRRLERLQCPGA